MAVRAHTQPYSDSTPSHTALPFGKRAQSVTRISNQCSVCDVIDISILVTAATGPLLFHRRSRLTPTKPRLNRCKVHSSHQCMGRHESMRICLLHRRNVSFSSHSTLSLSSTWSQGSDTWLVNQDGVTLTSMQIFLFTFPQSLLTERGSG